MLVLGCAATAAAQESAPPAEADPLDGLSPQEAFREGYRDAQIDLLNLLAKELSAYTLKEYGDWYAGRERYTDAMQHYLLALQTDGGLSIAHYRLAEVYAQSSQDHLVMNRLRRAVDAGFWGAEALQNDEAFDRFREHEEFAELLEQVEANHAQHAGDYTGKSLIVVPEGDAPETGWPVMVFLHGWGDDHRAYLDNCYDAVEQGWVGIAVSGTHGFAEDSYRWDNESDDSTHVAIQQALDEHAKKGVPLDRERVFLLGFSQGAMHAVHLICTEPDAYAGGIVLSIGGQMDLPVGVDEPRIPRRVVVVWGTNEHPGNIELCERTLLMLQSRPPPFRALEYTHDGGHHFPAAYDEKFPEWLEWLVAEEEASE